MADLKISQLPAATTPVVGTEVLPIVQSGTTSQVSINSATGITRPFTANGVVYASSSSALATGSALTFDGTNLSLLPSGYSVFGASSAEQMRLTSTGLGIGTSSPNAKLDVFPSPSSATFGGIRVKSATATDVIGLYQTGSAYTYGSVGSSQSWIYSNYGDLNITSDATGIIKFQRASGTETARFDSSGNLGLGVTPSAWTTTNAATAQLKNISIAALATNDLQLSSNAYFDGSSWRYIASSVAATNYYQSLGAHVWRNAVSGTAGNAITFTQAMTLDASGNLLVGTTNTSETTGNGLKLLVGGTPGFKVVTPASSSSSASFMSYSSGAGAYRFYVTDAGVINATSTTISGISDERLKENIRDIDTGLNAVMDLKPRRFDWKEGKGQNKKNAAGFIAQEFETVFPECVSTSKAGADGIEYKNINHETLIPTLVKAIQEQQALIESLTTRLTALEGKA
jgi:hypothetical protein